MFKDAGIYCSTFCNSREVNSMKYVWRAAPLHKPHVILFELIFFSLLQSAEKSRNYYCITAVGTRMVTNNYFN